MQNWIHTVAVLVQVISAVGVIVLVLLQHGKGADMGAAFGSGASGSLFGATGSANFLSRTTGVLAAAVWGVGLTDASRSQSFAAYAGGAAALVGFTASCLGLLTAVAPRVRRDPAHS